MTEAVRGDFVPYCILGFCDDWTGARSRAKRTTNQNKIGAWFKPSANSAHEGLQIHIAPIDAGNQQAQRKLEVTHESAFCVERRPEEGPARADKKKDSRLNAASPFH